MVNYVPGPLLTNPKRWVRVPGDPSTMDMHARPTVPGTTPQPHPTDRYLDPDTGTILWCGPTGGGDFWTTDLTAPATALGDDPLGVLWVSELGEERRAPSDLNRWCGVPGRWLMCLESRAFELGYVFPVPPDRDGDGVPDDWDPAPDDPMVPYGPDPGGDGGNG